MEIEMPIVHMAWTDKGYLDVPPHAKNVKWRHSGSWPKESYSREDALEYQGPYVLITYETHIGLCLKEYERNGYHDSDFYMIVWNPETKKPEHYMFATTRGWSYPCYASKPDATPEVKAAFEEYKKEYERERVRQERKARAKELMNSRNLCREVAKEHGFNHVKLMKMRKNPKFDGIMHLFGKRIRSGFKLSLRDQLVRWLKDPNPEYQNPFSKKQWNYI